MIPKIEFYIKKYSRIVHIFLVLLFFSILYTLFFSPVLFSNRLLAPGDGITQSVPAFYSPRTLWTPLLLSGFPIAADVTPQTWYPISLLFSLIPNSWNAFVVSAYVLASSFSYGYVYTVTNSRLAGLVTGIIYGMSGFMMAHLGHTTMIHTALWIPLLIWALEKLRHNFSSGWLALGVFAVSFCFLGGHPQIFVYGIGLSAAYAFVLGWSTQVGRWKYYGLYLAVVVLGLALAAIQIIPTIELASLGLRSKISFQEFVFCSLPLYESFRFLFPYLLGGMPPTFHGQPYSGVCIWGMTELTGYVGLLPLMLASVGFMFARHKSIAWFWLTACLLAFLLTLGEATPIAHLAYLLPVYNKFRIPGRHVVEIAMAVSVLAGLGVTALQNQVVSNRLLLRTVLVSTGVMLLSVIGIFLFSDQLQAKTIGTGTERITFLPKLNPGIGVPLVIFLLAVTTLIYWSKSTNSKFRGLWLLLILVIDLGSFGWFYEWQYAAPSQDLLTPTAFTQHYKKVLSASQQRMLPVRGGLGSVDENPPNLSRMWGVPSASGYGPLILSRVSQLFPMGASGDVWGNWASVADRSLDIMSIRYVFMPAKPSDVNDAQGVSWSREEMSLSLGNGCATQQPNSIKLQVPAQQSVTAIGIVSSLACSIGVANNTEVVRILVTDANGKVETQSLRAGRDTSEWAYGCTDVLPYIQHRQAPIFESFPVHRESYPMCLANKYVSVLPINKLNNVKSLELEWIGPSGAIAINKISLIDNPNRQSYPITEMSSYLANTPRWHHVEDINEATRVYENLRAMPRAWLVPEVVSAKPDAILNSIKTSKLPDGHSYEPSQIALVEEPLEFKAQNLDSTATAKIFNLSDTQVEIQTTSSSPAFLVLSDVYYPGWQATVDGKKVHVFQTNYVLRGILVPGGDHIVKFEFKSLSFHIGAGVSAASLALLGYLNFKFQQKQKLLLNE